MITRKQFVQILHSTVTILTYIEEIAAVEIDFDTFVKYLGMFKIFLEGHNKSN